MADNILNLPSGIGGLTRFKDTTKSKLDLKPSQVIGFIIVIVLFRISLNIFFK
jgi:hypothetical protein